MTDKKSDAAKTPAPGNGAPELTAEQQQQAAALQNMMAPQPMALPPGLPKEYVPLVIGAQMGTAGLSQLLIGGVLITMSLKAIKQAEAK
jgi:hypothetical protein